jgi:hypothetical protein
MMRLCNEELSFSPLHRDSTACSVSGLLDRSSHVKVEFRSKHAMSYTTTCSIRQQNESALTQGGAQRQHLRIAQSIGLQLQPRKALVCHKSCTEGVANAHWLLCRGVFAQDEGSYAGSSPQVVGNGCIAMRGDRQ